MSASDVPVVPGYYGDDQSSQKLKMEADKLGLVDRIFPEEREREGRGEGERERREGREEGERERREGRGEGEREGEGGEGRGREREKGGEGHVVCTLVLNNAL